jgi:hypothetical protein
MKILLIVLSAAFVLTCCNTKTENSKVFDSKNSMTADNNKIAGTWRLVYGEVKENDSLTIRDVTKSEFIKIINETHFAFFSQDRKYASLFYGAGGTYTIENNEYIEKLMYTAWDDYRHETFPFTVEIKNDTLIQYGTEEVKESNIKRYIIEK